MKQSETEQHKRIKEKIQIALQQWLEGASITEYPHSGQEVDVFHVLYNGTTIIVEIIWSDGYTHFLEDLDIIQNSDASVKVVIVNQAILEKEKFLHHYDKMRVAEFVLSAAMLYHLDVICNMDLVDILPPEKIAFIAYNIGVYESVHKFGGCNATT